MAAPGERSYKLTLRIKPESAQAWREAAAALGYVTDTGYLIFQGNVSALLDGIADGEVKLADLGRVLKRIRAREHRIQAATVGKGEMAPLLVRLAELEIVSKRIDGHLKKVRARADELVAEGKLEAAEGISAASEESTLSS